MKKISIAIFVLFFLSIPAFSQRDVNSIDDKLYFLQKEGKYDEAIADLNELINDNPNSSALYVKRAEFFGLQKKPTNSIADIDKAIEIEPNKAKFYLARAKYYKLLEDKQAVLKDVNIALSLDFKPANDLYDVASANILYNSAELLSSIGYFKENIKITDSYIARNKVVYWGYKIRSENKKNLKDYAGALEDSIKAIKLLVAEDSKELDPFTVKMELGTLTLMSSVIVPSLTELKDDKEVFTYYLQLIDLLTEKYNKFFEDGQKDDLEIRGKVSELAIYPFYSHLASLIEKCSELYISKGNLEKGDEILIRLLDIKNIYYSYSYRASIYQKRGKYKEAIEDLTHLIQTLKVTPKLFL
jgi:tetratricopeptide (TPR) repeat protein